MGIIHIIDISSKNKDINHNGKFLISITLYYSLLNYSIDFDQNYYIHASYLPHQFLLPTSVTFDNEPINTISDIPIDYSKITGSVATNLNNNSEDVSFDDLSNLNTNTSKIMTKKLLELMKYSNDLIIEVFSIVDNNNPKMAIKKLNKYNNNYKHVLEIPSKATKINDELIELIDNFNI
ncbi:hypothetical protein BDF21DRAFT_402494 [Thamnidium elegans]|nr:hypothetical protein BDF21DRAFT_402494 [Thamnidium elegans]